MITGSVTARTISLADRLWCMHLSFMICDLLFCFFFLIVPALMEVVATHPGPHYPDWILKLYHPHRHDRRQRFPAVLELADADLDPEDPGQRRLVHDLAGRTGCRPVLGVQEQHAVGDPQACAG